MWSLLMHSIIVENERDDSIYNQGWNFLGKLADLAPGVASWKQFMPVTETLHDRHIHNKLQTNLIEYIWALVEN
jgi:hypothetical protein